MDKDNYILYKKVFNNIVISKKIFNFVKYRDWVNNQDYSKYDEILSSFKIRDIKIVNLLNTNNKYLIDYVFDFYFTKVIYDPLKYWYYNIQIKDIQDIHALLKYKDLGFKRFKLFFDHFKYEFIYNSGGLLSIAANSNNVEIFNYLRDCLNKDYHGYDYRIFTLDFLNIECNDNIEIYKSIYIDFKLYNWSKSLVELTCKSNQYKCLQYFIENDLIIDKPSKEKQLDNYYITSIIIKYINNENILNLILKYDLLNPYIEMHFKVDQFARSLEFSTFINNKTHQQLLNGIKQIFGQKVNFNINENDSGVKTVFTNEQLLNKVNLYHKPSFDEFKILAADKNKLIEKIDNTKIMDILFYAGKVLSNLDYLKYIINYFIKNKIKLEIPVNLYDCEHHIIEYILQIDNPYIIKPDSNKFKLSHYPINIFNGDVKSAMLYYNLPSNHPLKLHYCHDRENNSAMPILYSAIRNNHIELLKYLLPFYHESLDFSNENLNFEIFKYLFLQGRINKKFKYYNSLNIYTKESGSLKIKNKILPMSYHKAIYFYQDKVNELLKDVHVLLYKDKLLLKQFLRIDALTTDSPFQMQYENNNFKLFSKLILKLLYTDNYSIIKAVLKSKRKPSKSIYKKTYKVQLIRYIISLKSPKLFYLIYKYDYDFLIDNLNLICQQILNSHSLNFLTQVMKQDYVHSNFKFQIMINTLLTIINNYKSFRVNMILYYLENINFDLINLNEFNNNFSQFNNNHINISKNNITKYNILNFINNNLEKNNTIQIILNLIISYNNK